MLADTHVPDLLPSLPPQIGEVFRGFGMILHTGDICRLHTLLQLQDSVTIAVAVERGSSEPRGIWRRRRS